MRVNAICYFWVEALKLSWTIIYSFSSPALMTEKAMLPSWFSSKMAEHVSSKSAYGEELPSAPCKTWSRSNKNAFLVLRQQDGAATRYCSITQSTLIHTSQLQFQKLYIHWVLDCDPGHSILKYSSGVKTQHCWVAGPSSPGWLSWFLLKWAGADTEQELNITNAMLFLDVIPSL